MRRFTPAASKPVSAASSDADRRTGPVSSESSKWRMSVACKGDTEKDTTTGGPPVGSPHATARRFSFNGYWQDSGRVGIVVARTRALTGRFGAELEVEADGAQLLAPNERPRLLHHGVPLQGRGHL
jgi:hypothetical protein